METDEVRHQSISYANKKTPLDDPCQVDLFRSEYLATWPAGDSIVRSLLRLNVA